MHAEGGNRTETMRNEKNQDQCMDDVTEQGAKMAVLILG
jgi:hypothetical protein